jgi:hypothetical protein
MSVKTLEGMFGKGFGGAIVNPKKKKCAKKKCKRKIKLM